MRRRGTVVGLLTLLLIGPLPGGSAGATANDAGSARISRGVLRDLSAEGTAEVLVTLDQADTLARAQAAGRGLAGDARVAAIRGALVSSNTQALDRVFAGVPGLEVLDRYETFGVAYVRVGSAAALEALSRRDGVEALTRPRTTRAALDQSLPQIRQPQAATNGWKGAGTSVAVLDSGLDYTKLGCTDISEPAACRVDALIETATPDGQLDDPASFHGTNVAAIAGGVAPDARLLAIDVFEGESAFDPDILEGIDWIITHQEEFQIRALNLSLGSGSYTKSCGKKFPPMAAAFAAADAVGILPVVASGNKAVVNGTFEPGVAYPSCLPHAVSVGAVYDRDVVTADDCYGGSDCTFMDPPNTCTDLVTAKDQITCFSQSSKLLTLLAPGAMITAAGIRHGGTSQAAPHVAGAAAVLAGEFPDASTDQITTAMRSTGLAIADARSGVTRRRLDLVSAVRKLKRLVNGAIDVDSTADARDADLADPACLTLAGTCTLRAAIQQANVNPGPDTIALGAGTYSLTLTNGSFPEDAAARGDLDVRDDVRIVGVGRDATFIQNGATFDDRLFQIDPLNTGIDVSITDTTLRHANYQAILNDAGPGNVGELSLGNVTIDGTDSGQTIENHGTLEMVNVTVTDGGGLYGTIWTDGDLSARQVAFSSNTGSYGGAIGITGGTTVLRHTSLTANDGYYGGAIYQSAGQLTLENTTLSGNSATGQGGAMYASAGTFTASFLDVIGNDGPYGGGLQLCNDATISSATVVDNVATTSGGGIRVGEGYGSCPGLHLTDVAVVGNDADAGGGLDAAANVPVAIDRATFSGNTATEAGGGGILNQGATMTLLNTTISGNTAVEGGGIRNETSLTGVAAIALLHVTLSGNGSTDGGGIQNVTGQAADVTLRSTIVANSTSGGDCSGDVTSLGYNLLESTVLCSMAVTTGDATGVDPKLGALAANGHPFLQTHALLSGSAAIDTASAGTCPSVDERSRRRPRLGGCDKGAYEKQS